MIHRILLCGLLALAASACALAETVKDREGAVRQDRATRENDPRWIYNDLTASQAPRPPKSPPPTTPARVAGRAGGYGG